MVNERTSLPSGAAGKDPHPEPEMPLAREAGRMREHVCRGGHDTDWLMSISDIRMLFKLGRTAAYELTRRPGFPAPVQVSRRCLRWWASEVGSYAGTLQHERAQRRSRRMTTPHAEWPVTERRRITGTVRAARSRKEQA